MLSYIVGLIIVILTITGLNFYALKAYGLEGYQSRYFFPFTFIGALVTLLSIFKIGYDTFRTNELEEKEARVNLSKYTDTIVINNWENDCINNPKLNSLYEKIMSKSFNDNFKFMSKEQWAKKKLKVPFIPYKGHELEWHYCAKFCQHLVNIYRMFDLDKKFKTNSKEDLKNSNFGLFAGWITTFKMFLSVPVVRNANTLTKFDFCIYLRRFRKNIS